MYPLSEVCREYGTVVVDLVVQIEDLNQDAEEDVDLGDDLLWFLLPTLNLWLSIDLDLIRDRLCECDILSIKSYQKGFCSGASGWVGFGNDLCEDIGCEAFADGGDGPKSSKGKSSIKQSNSAL